MPPRTRGDAKRQDTPHDKDKLGGKKIENGGKVSKSQNQRGKAPANSGGKREINTSMLDAKFGSNISTLIEQNEKTAAGSCMKICETIYVGGLQDHSPNSHTREDETIFVGGRQDHSPSSPTREAETIHVAGYEVDANPLLEENGIADPELDSAMLDTQDGESGSHGITSPAGRYEQVANTIEGVEHGEGEANPLSCRAGSNNHTEGDTTVQNTIAGTAEVVAQIEANASAGTGTETGNISLPDSCDEQDQQEIGVHLESDILDKGNRDCSKQRHQTFAAKATNEESYMNQGSSGKDGVEDHAPPEINGTHFARTSNATMKKSTDSLSESMVDFSNMNRVAGTPFGFLTTAERVTNPFTCTNHTTGVLKTTEKEADNNNMDAKGKGYPIRQDDVTIPDIRGGDKMGKRLREPSTDELKIEIRTGEEVLTRKRRRVGEGFMKTQEQRSEEPSVPTIASDERNTAEVDGTGVLCSVQTGIRKIETDKSNSDLEVPEARSDGEVMTAISKGNTNNGHSNTELHNTESMGAVGSASLEADTDRRNSDSDLREVGTNPDLDMACPAETADNELREAELDDVESLGEGNPHCCEVQTGKPISDTNMQEVRSDREVDRAFLERENDNGQSDKVLQEIESSGSVDYPSGATGTDKQNCDTDIPEVRNDEIGGDYNKARASYGEKSNDEQTNPELGAMESGSSMDTDSLNADTEAQNGDSDMQEVRSQLENDMPSKQGQGNADFTNEKPVDDAESILLSAMKENSPAVDYIEASQSPPTRQIGYPSEPESPQKQKGSFIEYTGVGPEDNLRRKELERSCVKKLEMKNAHLLIDMIDSLSSGKADMYYLLAFKIVLLIFPNQSWDHVQDRLPAMMGYATENIKTGLKKRVTDEVYTEYPSDKGVDERIICWNQRLELYKGIECGSRKLLDPICSSVSTCVENRPMESSLLDADIQVRARDRDHCQVFQDYFSDFASRAAFVFQSPQLRLEENRFVISILRQLVLKEQESSEAMFHQLKDITNAVVTSRMIGVTEATARQEVEMNLFELGDEESTREDDEKDGEDKEIIGDIRKQEILDNVKETIRHHEMTALRLQDQYQTSKERLNELEKGLKELHSCLFGSTTPYTADNTLEDVFTQMKDEVKGNLNITSIKEQENNRLLQQLEQIENEKKKLQNEKDEWKIKAERMESFCRGMEPKLLREDPMRKIQDPTVEDSACDGKDIEMNDSPVFAGTPNLDYEKTLESSNMTLKKENMELKDKIEKYESQLQQKVVDLTNENDEMKIGFRQLHFRAFGIELPPGSQRPYATILENLQVITKNIKAESSRKEIRIQELEQKFEETSQTLCREQEDKRNIQAQLDVKTQTISCLEDKLRQMEKEKECIQNKSDKRKAQINEMKNQYKSFEAQLLPLNLTRQVGNLPVKSSAPNDGANHKDAGDSVPKWKEELGADKASVKDKEESLIALQKENTDLLKTIANLEESIKTGSNENKTAYGKIKELEAQLYIQGMNQEKAVKMQTQIIEMEKQIKIIQHREQNYKDVIKEYVNQTNRINDWIEARAEQIKKVEQFLKDAETGVQEQNQAFVKISQELKAVQTDASNKEETYKSTEQETICLKERLEEMEQTISKKNKEVGDLTVQLQDAQRKIGKLTTALATVESTLDRERISSASEIERIKQEYEVRIDESENLNRRLREMEEVQAKAMNVQDAIERKDETISRLGKDIENIKEGHISEINRLTEEVRKVNSQVAQEKKGNSTVTNVNDRSYAIPELLEMALQKLERWKECGDKFVESQKRIDNVFSTIESIPSRLEQVLVAHQPSASADSVAQAAHDGILTRLEINVKDLKHAIDGQHISSQDNVEGNRMCHSVEEINKLMARVDQQREDLSKELRRLTEQTSQLNSGMKDKDKQCNEAVNTLLAHKSKCESDFEMLSERIPVLEIKQLTKQIHELQEQIRAPGPELKDNNQDLGSLREDICSIKAQTMHCQRDINQRDIIIERLPSDIQNLKSKLIDIEKAMVRQQIAYDEWRKASHYTPTRNTQRDESSNVSKLESQLSDLNHAISQLRDKDRLMNEVQKLQNSTAEGNSKFNGLKDTMDWLVEEVGKLQNRIRGSEAEAQERQYDMAKFLRLSTNAWISQMPAEEAAAKLNGNNNRRDELDGLREELSQVEKNIMYFTSTFPPPSGQPFSTVMEERFLSKVPVTERLKVLIERVRHRIDDLQSSLEQAKLNHESAMRQENIRSAFVSDEIEAVTPVSELNTEFLTPTEREFGAIESPTGQNNAGTTHRGNVLISSPNLGPRFKSGFTQTGPQEASKTPAVEGHEAFHVNTYTPMGSRQLEEEHALGSDSVRADLERLRASLIFHLCAMLLSRERSVNVEGLREGSRIFSRRTIGKGNLELLEKVIEGYSRQSMKNRGANKELRKITYKGRKAFPDALLKIYTTIFKTLLTLTEHLGINESMADDRSTKANATPLDKGANKKPRRKRSNLA